MAGRALALEYFAYLYFIKFPAMTKFSRASRGTPGSASSCAIFGDWVQILYAAPSPLSPPWIPYAGVLSHGRSANVVALSRCPRVWAAQKNLTHFAQIFEFLHFICSPLRHFSVPCYPLRPLFPPLSPSSSAPLTVCSPRCRFVSTLCELLASPAALSMHSSICVVRLGLDLCVYFMCVVVLPKIVSTA